MKRALSTAAMVFVVACGDVETWEASVHPYNSESISEYTSSEERCRKHGQVLMHRYGTSYYTCKLVAIHEDFPGGEMGARVLSVVIPWLASLLEPAGER